MNNKIKILILEDVLSDLELVLMELKKANIIFEHLHVETEEDFRKALVEFNPDLILSDYMLPQFTGIEALLIVKETYPNLPFIIVTGSVNEIVAVDCMKAGAMDYILKERLGRLGAAVNSALERKAEIDARKKAEEKVKLYISKLEVADAEKDKFLSIIAHDLRSPFNSLLGLTQIMAEQNHEMNPQKVQKIALSMYKTATNLYGLLNNLLEWLSMKRGKIPFNSEPANLKQAVQDILVLINASAVRKKIKITDTIQAYIMVCVDLNMLRSILRNLLFNAVKFTDEGGEVTISSITSVNNMVEVSVEDTGIGMSDELIGTLFTLDKNISRPGTAGEPSTGLGLIICKEFIEKHGGEIRIESEVGKGSIFSFTIPLFNSAIQVDSGNRDII